MSTLKLSARQDFAVEVGTKLDRWMFAPGGVHTISLGADGGSAKITLRIDETTAAVLNASLAKLNAENSPQRAFIDKEHDAQAGATAWPQRFVWSESPQPGVYVELEASAYGRQLVEGKVIRAFSPSFYADADLPKSIRPGQHIVLAAGKRGSNSNPARMTGLVFPAVGTLTNDPAFRKILPLWAKRASGAPSGNADNTTNTTDMKLTAEQKAALQARKNELEQSLPALRAKAAGDTGNAAFAEELDAAEHELEVADTKLKLDAAAARNEELETALRAQRTKDADAGVADAIKRGAIAAKDTATQENWKIKCIEDPSNLVLLASMRGSPSLEHRRIITPNVQISREDSVTVLRAYNQEKDPEKKGQLYAAELSKRISDNEQLPLMAGNALGTLAGEIVAQRALELLTAEEPMLNFFSTDFTDENAKLDQEVNTRIVGIPTSSNYDEDTGYADNDAIMVDVPVTITAHRSTQAAFNANDLAGTNRRLFEEIAPAQAEAIANDVMAIVFAVITAANFANKTTEALVDFGRPTVISMGGDLRDRKVKRNRFLLLRGNYYDSLFKDAAVVNLAGQQKAELITGDEMIPIHGFMPFRASTLPAVENLQGFGGGKSSIVVAGRVPADYANALPGVTGGGTSQVITNVKTGLSVHLVQYVDHKLGKARSRMAYMLGAGPGQAVAGQRLVNA
jgi:hypothetical protein